MENILLIFNQYGNIGYSPPALLPSSQSGTCLLLRMNLITILNNRQVQPPEDVIGIRIRRL